MQFYSNIQLQTGEIQLHGHLLLHLRISECTPHPFMEVDPTVCGGKTMLTEFIRTVESILLLHQLRLQAFRRLPRRRLTVQNQLINRFVSKVSRVHCLVNARNMSLRFCLMAAAASADMTGTGEDAPVVPL